DDLAILDGVDADFFHDGALAGGVVLDVHAELHGESGGPDVGAFGETAEGGVALGPELVLGFDVLHAMPGEAAALDADELGGPELGVDLPLALVEVLDE